MSSVVFVLSGDASRALAAVGALAAAVDSAEREGNDVEVIIVDDTVDPSVAEALKDVEGATIVTHDSRLGVSTGWQEGLRLTKASPVVLCCTDAEIDSDLIARLVDPFEATRGVGLVVPFGASQLASCAADREVATAGWNAEDPTEAIRQLASHAERQRKRVVSLGPSANAPPQFNPTAILARPDALTVGAFTYAGPATIIQTWSPMESIRIGAFCSISDEVRILHSGNWGKPFRDQSTNELVDIPSGDGHRVRTASTFPIGMLVHSSYYESIPSDGSLQWDPLTIGSDVWIGYRSTIVGSVTVGDGAVIGAGSVVTQDVPPYAIVAGNRAEVVRRRFPDDVVDALLRIRWWEWPIEEIVANHRWFLRPIEAFVERFDPARNT